MTPETTPGTTSEPTIEQLANLAHPQQPHRKKWLKWVILAAFLIIVIVSSVALVVFALWSGSPQKALLDAADYAMKEQASYTLESGGTSMRLQVGERSYHAEGTLAGIKIEAIVTDNTLYIRTANPEKLLTQSTNGLQATSSNSLLQPVFKELQDQWISIDLQTPTVKSGELSRLSCGVNTKTTLTKDNAARQELAMTYLAHQFIAIGPAAQTGSDMSYDLSLHDGELKAFQSAFEKTELYKSLASCSQSPEGPLDATGLAGVKATVVLTKDHHLKKLTVQDDSGQTAHVTAEYGPQPAVTVPSNARTLEQLASDLFRNFMPGL